MLGSLTLRGIHDLLRLPLSVRKDLLLLHLRLGGGGPDGLQILIGRRLRGVKHTVQRERGLGDGAGVCEAQLPVLQLRLGLGQLLLGLLLLLLQRIDDIDQICAAQPPQFLVRHGIAPSFFVRPSSRRAGERGGNAIKMSRTAAVVRAILSSA